MVISCDSDMLVTEAVFSSDLAIGAKLRIGWVTHSRAFSFRKVANSIWRTTVVMDLLSDIVTLPESIPVSQFLKFFSNCSYYPIFAQ